MISLLLFKLTNDLPVIICRRTKSLYGASPNCQFGPKASLVKSSNNVL